MDHRLVNGVWSLVREYAGRQAGHQLGHLKFMREHHHIVLHLSIQPPELHGLALQREQRNINHRDLQEAVPPRLVTLSSKV